MQEEVEVPAVEETCTTKPVDECKEEEVIVIVIVIVELLNHCCKHSETFPGESRGGEGGKPM